VGERKTLVCGFFEKEQRSIVGRTGRFPEENFRGGGVGGGGEKMKLGENESSD